MNHSSSTRTQALLFKFIDFIEVKLQRSEYRAINHPFYFSSQERDTDIFVKLCKGNFFLGKEIMPMKAGSFYFIPRRHNNSKVFSKPLQHGREMFSDGMENEANFSKMQTKETLDKAENVICYVTIETVLYNSFPFFPLMDLPPFVIPPDETLSFLMSRICIEQEDKRLGREIILKNYATELMVQIFRHINARPEFDKIIDKLQYLADIRLIGIVKYIQENLDKELTNASIAKVASVSDEYVGQFFKSLTGKTLQDYIEARRMERAMHLLQTIPNSVQEIASMVGFRDAAYFSRRFRLHFKVNANVLRRDKVTTPGTSE